MKKCWTAVVLSLVTVIGISEVKAQEEIKVLSYNVLNYPNPDYDDHRADTLRKIIDFYTPDIFLMQELKSAAGLQTLLDVAFNHSGETAFASGTWLSQVSNPNTSWPLQQNVIYNTQKLTLLEESYLLTVHRDLNLFKFLVNDENLSLHQDSTFVYAFSIHLKSSQGGANVQARRDMVEVLTDYLATLEADATVIVAGDFNVYSSMETGYQLLINPNNALPLKDPINTPGNWHDNASFSDVHTQSTRVSQINEDGAGGGMDDRFDFILLSGPVFNEDARVKYIDGTYENLGNTGNCFNQRLIDCTGGSIPSDVVYAMYQMSDHLPVKLEMEVHLPSTSTTRQNNERLRALTGSNLVRNQLAVSAKGVHEIQGSYSIVNSSGHEVYRSQTAPVPTLDIYTGHLSPGLYLLVFDQQDWKPFRFLKF
jgi:endonuclease/exonuclease/phosphatase family metal-dependent hydrolase